MVFQIQTEYDIAQIVEKRLLIVTQTELVNVKPVIFDLELSKWRKKMNNEAIKKLNRQLERIEKNESEVV